MGKCETCQTKPFHPDKKCCFNCGRDGDTCGVWHNCGHDCSGWEPKIQTNADRIRAMNDDELRNFLCGLMNCSGCTFGSSSGCTLKAWLQMPSKEGDHEAEP